MKTGKRMSNISRQTRETEISLALQLDGMGQTNLKTGVPFLEHMLDLFAKHGKFDLFVEAKGDTHIDDHHTVEDIAICLGQALREALGDKRGIRRYGNAFVPMDEALGQVVVDLSNRPIWNSGRNSRVRRWVVLTRSLSMNSFGNWLLKRASLCM